MGCGRPVSLAFPCLAREGGGRAGRVPHSEHRFPAPSSKDVVNQCLEFGRVQECVCARACIM